MNKLTKDLLLAGCNYRYGCNVDEVARNLEQMGYQIPPKVNTSQTDINTVAKELCSKYQICTCNKKDGHCSTPQQHAKIILELGYKKEETVLINLMNEINKIVDETEFDFGNKDGAKIAVNQIFQKAIQEYRRNA